MSTLTPHNAYWAVAHSILAGEYPGDRDPAKARAKLTTFLDSGVRAFLDLTHAGELAPYEHLLADLARERGLMVEHRRMPIRDVDVPRTPDEMRAILAQLRAWIDNGQPAYVHCWGGVGRTGTVIGCWFVEQGATGEAALAHLARLWQGMSADKLRRKPHSPETEAQRDYIRKWRATNAGHCP
ncbi:MAG: hypothetical protein FJ294_11280 [Planctomycetes bacterium]|nr:hypothetical protein [Planctomycetota bacterium]